MFQANGGEKRESRTTEGTGDISAAAISDERQLAHVDDSAFQHNQITSQFSQQDNPLEREESHLWIITYPQAVKTILLNSRGPLGVSLVKGSIPFIYSIMMSHLSLNTEIKAAASLINTYDDFVSSVLNAPLDYINTAVGELNNEANQHKVGRVVQASWLLSICLSAPQVLLLVSSEAILEGCGQAPELAVLVGHFFKIASIGYPFFSMQVVSDRMALTTGHKYLPVISQVLGLAGGLLAAYPVIYGKWGAPDLNFMGLSWFFVARAGINFSVFLSYLAMSNHIGPTNERWGSFAVYDLFKFQKEEFFPIFKNLFVKGLPISFIYASEMGAGYLLNMLIGVLGKNQLAARLVMSQYQGLLLILVSACGAASQITISNALGTIDRKNIIKYGHVSIGLSLIVPAIYILLTLIIPDILMQPFVNSEDSNYKEIRDLLDHDKLLLIGGVNLSLNAIRIVSALSLIGAGMTGPRLIANVLLEWIGVGIGYILAFHANFGMIGLILGYGMGLIISAIAQALYWINTASNISEQDLQENSEDNTEMLPITHSSSRGEERRLALTVTQPRIEMHPALVQDQSDMSTNGERQPLTALDTDSVLHRERAEPGYADELPNQHNSSAFSALRNKITSFFYHPCNASKNSASTTNTPFLSAN